MKDYLFSSARIRVLENRLIGEERIAKLLAADTQENCLRLLAELGVDLIYDENGSFCREKTLAARLQAAYDEVFSYAEDPAFLRLWLYPYDCNNIKAAIKCAYRGVSVDGLMFNYGRIDPEVLFDMAVQKDFSQLPEHFAKAAAEAQNALYNTANPQWVDLILDRACYGAMLQEATQSRVGFAIRLVKKKIDLTNLMMCVRVLRRNCGQAGEGALRDSLLPGGELSEAYLLELYRMGEAALWEKLSNGELRRLADAVAVGDRSLSAIERAADNHWMQLIREAKMIPFGAETLIGYLLGSEYEVRNLRILLSGIDAGMERRQLRERMRDSYV